MVMVPQPQHYNYDSFVFKNASVFISRLIDFSPPTVTRVHNDNLRFILFYFMASVFRLFTPQALFLMPSFNKKSDQCIAAHLFSFHIKLLASVLPLLTPQTLLLRTSFNKKMISASPRICFVFRNIS
jgi:hypothetical protein